MSAIAQASLPLFGPPQAWQTAIYRRRMTFVTVDAYPQHFRRDFREWLEANYKIWPAFEREASRIWDLGRRHYSARTIGEYLRHESALREQANELGFKLNDHYWPDLARLYMLLNPDRDKFFEKRVSPATLRAA
jgi:hypothetical protein